MSNANLHSDILALPVAERLELVGKIWDSIKEDELVNDEHRKILEQRLAEHRANPSQGIGWEELKAKLRNSK